MQLTDFDYPLPSELIAQAPVPARGDARLLVVSRHDAPRRHARVMDLPRLLDPGDLLVLNDTRVIPARVRGRRPSGGRLEILFVRPLSAPDEWEVLVRGTPHPGETVHLADGRGEWVASLGSGRWRLRLELGRPVLAWLEQHGEVPLPPYIRRPDGPSAEDAARYQTVFARSPGAIAAPTAGLHFTPELLRALADGGIGHVMITLHVGPGTFLPIRPGEDLDTYTMLPERYVVTEDARSRIAAQRAGGGRVVAVGTTTVRAIEGAAVNGALRSGAGETDLFIRPGHAFRIVDAMLTNFHLPQTPLLALVAAFAGWERVRSAYAEAADLRYRFYSYGDAMLIT